MDAGQVAWQIAEKYRDLLIVAGNTSRYNELVNDIADVIRPIENRADGIRFLNDRVDEFDKRLTVLELEGRDRRESDRKK